MRSAKRGSVRAFPRRVLPAFGVKIQGLGPTDPLIASRYPPQMRVAVAADHAGFPLKEPIIGWVRDLGHEPVDFGTDSTDPVDYPDVIAPAARAVAIGECDRAIVLGGSGTGEAIVANKIGGIAASRPPIPSLPASAVNTTTPMRCRWAPGSSGPEIARACVEAFLSGEFEGGRHARRVEKIGDRASLTGLTGTSEA